jgi:phosphoglycolate phosphatase
VRSLRSPAVVGALLLDFDQTLVDSHGATDWCGALRELAARFGPLPIPAVAGCALQTVGVLAAERDPARWAAMSELVEGYELAGAAGSTLMPHVPALLAGTLHLPKAIVTSGSAASARAVLARLGVSVEAVVGRSPGLAMKPAPGQVQEALRLLGVSPGQAVMAGDSVWDEAAARAAGVRFIGLANGRPRPGFDPATTVVEDLRGLLDLLTHGDCSPGPIGGLA